MSRRILVLSAVLVAQLALIAVLFWPRASLATASLLFPGFDPEQITGITLTWDQNVLTLEKEGEQWVLPAVGNFPVNELTVTSLLTKVAQIDTGRLVADTGTSHTRLRVGENDAIRKVEMTTSGGESVTLYIGSAPTARATHVRAQGSDAVYLTSALSTADVRTDEGAWINTLYLQTNPDAVRALTLENAQGTFTLERESDGSWTTGNLAEGESVDAGNADLLVSRLASLSMIKPLGATLQPEYGLEPPTATVTLELTPTVIATDTAAAPERIQLVIGVFDGVTNSYAVKASTSDYVVSVAAATLDPFVTFGRSDLVVTPAITTTESLTGTGSLTDTASLTPTFSFTDTAP